MPRLPDFSPGSGERAACEQIAALIDAWADGELSAQEQALLDQHTAECPACAADLALAQDLAQGFARLPRPACPPRIVAAVLAQAAAEPPHSSPLPARAGRGGRNSAAHAKGLPARAGWWGRRGEGWRGALRPALAAGLAASLAAASLLVFSPGREPRVSPEEVARAEAQVKLTFAYLGRMGSATGTLVRDEVIENVVNPTRRVLAPAAGASGNEVQR